MTSDELIKVLDTQVRCLDELAVPLVKSLANVQTRFHPADIHPSVIVLCSSVIALHPAIEDAREVIGGCEGTHDVRPKLLAAAEAVKEAAKEFFEAVQGAVFSGGLIMPRHEWTGERADLRSAASFASAIIDAAKRFEMGLPTNKAYRRDLERAGYCYYTFINALLIVLALDAIRAATKRGDVSAAASAIVLKMSELGRGLEKERKLLESDGIEPALLAMRARNKALQDEITDELRAFRDGYPKVLSAIPDKRADALLRETLSRGIERFGVMVLSALVGGDHDASLELLRDYDADQKKYARGLQS